MTEDEWLADQLAKLPPLSPRQCEEIARLVGAPAPLPKIENTKTKEGD